MARRLEYTVTAEEALRILESDSGANIYPYDSSSDDEDLLCDDDYEEFTSSSQGAGPSTPFRHGSTPRSHHRPLQPKHSSDHGGFKPASPTTSPTPTRTPQKKRRRVSGPLSPPPSAESDSDSPAGVSEYKNVKVKEEEEEVEVEEERWHYKEEADTRPNPLRFMPARTPGPTFDATAAWSPLSLFRLYFSASTVRTIIRNTNTNAARRIKAGLKFKWTPLTESDFWIFLSIILFTGLVSVHQRSDYWRQEWPYRFSFPRNRMTRSRFEAILFSLHISDPIEDEENDRKRNTPEYDRLFKLKPLYTEMVSACQALFQPYQNICIDERMVASKARISIKQYMKNKPIKWGYKVFVLADAETAYTFNFYVYQGKSESTTAHGLNFSSVWNLLPFQTLGGGYTLYVDNFYTSPTLFEELWKKNIGCCGTIRTNRVSYPKINDLPKNADRGDMRWFRRGKHLFVRWKDTREVNMCSTVHEAFTGETVKRRVKEAGVWNMKTVPVPSAVVDYNRFMGGVDLSDALIKYYSVHHKTTKWYKTFFYHFIDVAVVNGFILHKEVCKRKNEKPYTQKIFREKLVEEMLEFATDSAPPQPPAVTCMPIFYGPGDIEGDDKRKYCRRCNEAGQKRVKTRIYCRKCQVPLCFVKDKNCFAEWHDAKH